jgi:acyl carrier protein
MDQEKLKLRIGKILKSILKTEKKKIEDISISNLDSWDSLKHITIILTLEEQINIKFTNDEISKATSFKNIFNIILQKLKKN